MALMRIPGNFARAGVVWGFPLSFTNYPYATPLVGLGVLFAQGVMYRPTEYPTVTAPTAGQKSYLWYNSSSGWSWTSSFVAPHTGDAFIGWMVRAADGTIVRSSAQTMTVPDFSGEAVTVIPLGPVMPTGPGGGGGGGTYGDTGVPGTPTGTSVSCWWSVTGASFTIGGGSIRFRLSKGSETNWHSIKMAEATVWYRDLSYAEAGGLTAAVNAGATTFAVGDGGAFTEGSYYLIDWEIVLVETIDGNTLHVQRAQLGSAAAAHYGPGTITAVAPSTGTLAPMLQVTCAGHGRQLNDAVSIAGVLGEDGANGGWLVATPATDTFVLWESRSLGTYTSGGTIAGSKLYALVGQKFLLPFEPPFWVDATEWWSPDLVLQNGFLCACQAVLVNAFGSSATGLVNAWLDGGAPWDGIDYTGQTGAVAPAILEIAVDGILAIASDVAPPVTAPNAVCPDHVFVEVAEAPTGGDIVLAVKVNGTRWAPFVIKDGETSGYQHLGMNAGPWPAGAQITIDILSVGTTYPGRRLVVTAVF